MVCLYLGEDRASQQNDVGQASSLPVTTAHILRGYLVITDHTRV